MRSPKLQFDYRKIVQNRFSALVKSKRNDNLEDDYPMNAALFISTVLIWGTTWIAIAWQVGPVPVVVSVFYRFALAGVLFLITLALLGKLKLPERAEQPWVLAQAFCLFSLNFICFYTATADIPSGLVSLVFSLATIFNAVNSRLFFGDKIEGRAILTAVMGIGGLVLLFGAELTVVDPAKTLRGVGFAALGTLFFSFGNMVSRRNSAAGISTLDANSWGMLYGSVILLIIIQASGVPIVMPSEPRYLGALLYLAVIGSIVGFTTYLMMVARIGASKAAYATVLFPIVALTISTFVEGYEWSLIKVCGVALALAGNAVRFSKGGLPFKALRRSPS